MLMVMQHHADAPCSTTITADAGKKKEDTAANSPRNLSTSCSIKSQAFDAKTRDDVHSLQQTTVWVS